MKQRWLSYAQAAGREDKYLKLARRWRVSTVARSRSGFMGVYARAGSAARMKKRMYSKTQTWENRRDGFVKRHLAQYAKHPTPRRALALRMWAYDTGDGILDAHV